MIFVWGKLQLRCRGCVGILVKTSGENKVLRSKIYCVEMLLSTGDCILVWKYFLIADTA